MNRFLAQTSKVTAALLAAGISCAPLAAFAQAHAPNLWFFGSRLIFTESRPQMGDLAVSVNDPGLQHFLAKLGATVSFQSGQRYIIVTAADHRSIAFSIGSARYMVDGAPQDAPFAVVEEDTDAYIPFYTLARALNVAPVQAGSDTILQPQIADVETQTDRGRTVVIFHGAATLHPQIVSGTATRTVVRFPGTASTLPAERDLELPGLTHMSVGVTGPVRNPTTTVTFTSPRGMHIGFLPAPDATSSVLALAPSNVPLHASVSPFETAQAVPVVQPVAAPHVSAARIPVAILPPAAAPEAVAAIPQSPAPLAPLAVTAVSETATPESFTVKLAVTGTPNYSWRLLGDGRFYIDIHNAALTTPVREEALNDARVSALRLRANGTPAEPNVRLALTLVQSPSVAVKNDAAGITLTIGGQRVSDAQREGSGRVGASPFAPTLSATEPALPAIVPVAAVPVDPNTAWKFAPSAARNNRLIVLDPGHGGSDSGAEHNGLTEKVLTLDIARRLRTLLIARGWQVKMTRDSDVDVYQPNDSAHDELQARCDIANAAGARLFVSIHINSFTSSDLQGTTTYYYHPQDAAFASIVESKLISALGTQNDGPQHANFYVIHHTTMPAILVETAFLSNPDDAARLRSETFRQSVASAITDGITTYVGGTRTVPRSQNDDADTQSSYVPPSYTPSTHHLASHSQSLVRSASSMDDDLSQ